MQNVVLIIKCHVPNTCVLCLHLNKKFKIFYGYYIAFIWSKGALLNLKSIILSKILGWINDVLLSILISAIKLLKLKTSFIVLFRIIKKSWFEIKLRELDIHQTIRIRHIYNQFGQTFLKSRNYWSFVTKRRFDYERTICFPYCVYVF